MYLRFETDRMNHEFGIHIGLFQMAYELLRSEEISEEERVTLNENLEWFRTNLPVARKYKRGRRDRARCWIKGHQRDTIARMYELRTLLESMGISVQLLKTRKPGYITWEDEFQVAAVPFRDKG